MKLINKDGKLFGKVNIIDILVVFLIVAAVIFVGARIADSGNGSTMQTAVYKFEIEKVRMQTVEAWAKNSLGIVDAEGKDLMGDIVSIYYEPARELVKKADGSYCIAEHSDRYDVTLTLNVAVNETDKGYYTANNVYIAAGKTLGLSNGFAQTFGEITDVSIK